MFDSRNASSTIWFTTVGVQHQINRWYSTRCRVVVKTSSRALKQENGQRQLLMEQKILCGTLRDVEGVIKLIDVIYFPGITQLRAHAYEYLPETLWHVHMTPNRRLLRDQIKTCARTLLETPAVMHRNNIVHTGIGSI